MTPMDYPQESSERPHEEVLLPYEKPVLKVLETSATAGKIFFNPTESTVSLGPGS